MTDHSVAIPLPLFTPLPAGTIAYPDGTISVRVDSAALAWLKTLPQTPQVAKTVRAIHEAMQP